MIFLHELKEGQRIFKMIRDCDTREWFVGTGKVVRIWKTPKRGDIRANVLAENFSSNGKDRWTFKTGRMDWHKTPLDAVERAIWSVLDPDPFTAGRRYVEIFLSLEKEVESTERLFALWRSLKEASK